MALGHRQRTGGACAGRGLLPVGFGHRSTGIVLAIVATTPLVVIPFTMLLDGERPTARSLAGGAVAVLGAAALAYK